MADFSATTDFNPYAPPDADLTASDPDTAIYREGDDLVVPRWCTLPPRCVKCNAPQDGEYLERKLYWHAAGWYLLLFMNIFIYALVAASVRKSATVQYALCAEHRKRRRRDYGIIIAILVGGGAIGIAGPMVDVPALLLLLPISWLAAALYAILRTNPFRAMHIDVHQARLRGVSTAFLASVSS